MLYITIRKVSNDMYRSRMGGGKPDSRVLDYLSSAEADSEIIKYDILGSQAHVLMLLKVGLVSRSNARKIFRALEDILNKLLSVNNAQYAKNTTTEDIHELVESLVIKKTSMASGGRMHAARSRNDQVALDIRMKIRDDINTLCLCILDVIDLMIQLASDHKRTIMPLYTHMQQAQSGLLSHWLLAHVDALLRDYDRLSDAFGRVNKSPLGSGPVGGTSLRIDRDYTSQLLGFDGLVENSLDATSTRDFAVEYSAVVSIMMSNLSRLAEDIVMWSTSEFSFVELADNLASPSSAMPQKKNPDVLEITRAKAAQVAGCVSALLGITSGLASGYGRDLQQTKPLVWSVSNIGISTLLALQSIFDTNGNHGMHIHKRRMRSVVDSSDLVALDLAEHLVLKYNVPFRAAHGVSAVLIQHAHTLQKPVSKLAVHEIKKAIINDKNKVADAKQIHAITSVSLGAVSSLQNRVSKGSSGYEEQKRMIIDRKKLVTNLREQLDVRTKKIDNALTSLYEQIKAV